MSDTRHAAVEVFVIAPLTNVVDRIARSQARRAERYLGSITDNVSIGAWEGAIERIANSAWDIRVLMAAAESLADVPYHENVKIRDFDDESVGRARAYILNTIRKEAVKAINNAFREQPTLDSIEKGDSVLDSFTDLGDPLAEKFAATQNPIMLGARFPAPGGTDWAVVSMAIASIITAKRLDPVVEVLLSDEHLYADGSFMWAKHGDKVWYACGLPLNVFYRQRDRGRRAEMAKRVVRNRLSWLPDAIRGALTRLSPEHWTTPRGSFEAMPVLEITQEVDVEARARDVLAQLVELVTA